MIDDQGLVYANPAKTELIGVVPNFPGDFSGGFANVVIPASVKAITGYVDVTPTGTGTTAVSPGTNHGAFQDMTSLTNVTFASNNVTRIGAQAFKGCSNLATISLPSSVSYIGTSAFENCNKLNTINLQNVSYIGNSAFKSAFSSIPTSSVELNVDKANYVGREAFKGTSGLKTINFANNTVLQTVANSAFMSSGITSLDLSQATKLLTIDDSAFQSCTSLTDVKVPKSLKEFGGETTGSSSIKLPSGLTQIGQQAFAGATSLTSVNLPAGLTTISGSAFAGSGITSLDLSTTALTTIQNGAFANTANLTSLTVPKTLATLNSGNTITGNDIDATFYGSGITSLDLSTTALTTINASTFNGATKLETVKLPSTVTRINENAFKGTTALKNLTQEAPAASETPAAPGSRATGNQLASTLTYIGTSAFQGTGLESIDLSQTKIQGTGDNSLGNSAFQDAASLKDVTLPTGLIAIPAASFANTTSLKKIEIPSTVNRINAGNDTYLGAFQGSGLTSIDLSQTKVTGVTTADQDGS